MKNLNLAILPWFTFIVAFHCRIFLTKRLIKYLNILHDWLMHICLDCIITGSAICDTINNQNSYNMSVKWLHKSRKFEKQNYIDFCNMDLSNWCDKRISYRHPSRNQIFYFNFWTTTFFSRIILLKKKL